MNFHTIDSVTLMKAIELIDQYNWQQSNQSNVDTTDMRLVLSSLRNCLKTTEPLSRNLND
jgi:hypothetical protein